MAQRDYDKKILQSVDEKLDRIDRILKKLPQDILEHFEMMDNPGYDENAIRKIRAYEKNGILQGERLILTYETSQTPIDMRVGGKWMKTIEIYGGNYLEQYTKLRETCRGIVIRNDEILLTYEVNTDQWFIPGGGVEKDECIQECCVRELAEETGCIVEIDKPYLSINEHYDEWLFVSHYYICNYVGETERTLTEREIEVGLEPRWVSLKEAIDIFSEHREYENDMKRGAYLREYNALLSYVESVEM